MNKKLIAIRLPADDLERLRELAERHKTTVSRAIRIMLRKGFAVYAAERKTCTKQVG